MSDFWIGLIGGLYLGAGIGYVVGVLMKGASQADDSLDQSERLRAPQGKE